MSGSGARSPRAHYGRVLISPDKAINERRGPDLSQWRVAASQRWCLDTEASCGVLGQLCPGIDATVVPEDGESMAQFPS